MAPEDDAAETTGEEKMDIAADAAQVASVMVVSSGLKRGRGVLVDALDGIMPDTLWSSRRHHHMRGAGESIWRGWRGRTTAAIRDTRRVIHFLFQVSAPPSQASARS